MPKKFTQHRTPPCEIGRRVVHQVYDKKRYEDGKLGPAASFRSSVRWQRVRNSHMAKFPLCADPFHDHDVDLGGGVPASGVHHVVPLIERVDLGCNPANLRSLCSSCHHRVEVMYRQDRSSAVRLFLTQAQEDALLGPPLKSTHVVATPLPEVAREGTGGHEAGQRSGIDHTGIPPTPYPLPCIGDIVYTRGDIDAKSETLHTVTVPKKESASS